MIPRQRFDGRKDEDAPVLVLANALGTTLEMWEPQMKALTEHFRVLRYDARGHGRSQVPPGPYSMEDLARDLFELLDALRLDVVAFCGLSLGGMVGIWAAAEEPERFDRLALCCTSAYVGPREIWEERAALVRAEGVGAVAESVLERWFTPGFHASHPEVVDRFRRMLLETPREGYAACCDAIRFWDYRPRLSLLCTPALVLAAEDDPSTPPDHSRLLVSRIPDSELVILPGVRHMANVEQPEAFTQTVLEFLLSDIGP